MVVDGLVGVSFNWWSILYSEAGAKRFHYVDNLAGGSRLFYFFDLLAGDLSVKHCAQRFVVMVGSFDLGEGRLHSFDQRCGKFEFLIADWLFLSLRERGEASDFTRIP